MEGKKKILDFLGISASLICAVHCILPPVLISYSAFNLLPFLENPVFEFILLGSALLFALISLWPSYKDHSVKTPLLLAIIAFSAMSIGLFLHIENVEMISMVLGGGLLAYAHFYNWKLNNKRASLQILSAS